MQSQGLKHGTVGVKAPSYPSQLLRNNIANPLGINPVKYQNRQSPPFRSGGRGSKQVSAALEQCHSQDSQNSTSNSDHTHQSLKQYVLFFGRSSPCFARIISENGQEGVMLQPLRPNPIDPKLLIPWGGHLWLAKRDKIRPVQMKQHAFGLEVKADDFVLSYMQLKHSSKQPFVYPVVNKEAKGIAQDDNWDVISLESSEYDDSSKLDFSLFPHIQPTATTSSAAGSSSTVAPKSFSQNSTQLQNSSPRYSQVGGNDTPGVGNFSSSSITTTPNTQNSSSTMSKGPIKLSKPSIPLRGPVTSTPNFLIKPISKSSCKDITPSSLRKNLMELSGKSSTKSSSVTSPSDPAYELTTKSRSDSITSEIPNIVTVPSTASQDSIVMPIEVAGIDQDIVRNDDDQLPKEIHYETVSSFDDTSRDAIVETSHEEYLTFAKTIFCASEDFRTAAQQLQFQPTLRPPLARAITPLSSNSTPKDQETSPELSHPASSNNDLIVDATCSTPTNRTQPVDSNHTHKQIAKYESPDQISGYQTIEKSCTSAISHFMAPKTPSEASGIAVQESLIEASYDDHENLDSTADFVEQSAAVDLQQTEMDSDNNSVATQPQGTDLEAPKEISRENFEKTPGEESKIEVETVQEEVPVASNDQKDEHVPEVMETVEVSVANAETNEQEQEDEDEDENEENVPSKPSKKEKNKKTSTKAKKQKESTNESDTTNSNETLPSSSSSSSSSSTTLSASKPPLHPSKNNTKAKSKESEASSNSKKRTRSQIEAIPEPPPRRSRPQTISIQNKRDAIFGSWPTRKQSAASGDWTI